MTAPTLNPALRDFWEAAYNEKKEPVRVRVLYGGRSSSKSWDAAGFVVFLAQRCKIKVLCARQFQNKIEESVYTLIVQTIERFGLREQFRILENKIIHKVTGSEFIFYGLWRHITEIKSLEGVDICWLEEAHALTPAQWEILEPTIRKEGSQIWLIFNPRYSTDFVWRRFVINPPFGALVRSINYHENPFISDTMLRVIAAAKAEDEEDYNHVYCGVPRDNDDKSIIKRAQVMSSIDAHIRLGLEPVGARTVGFDVGDGGDPNALVYAYGSLISWADEWKGKDDELATVSTVRARRACLERDASLIYDSVGMGAFVGSAINALNKSDFRSGVVSHTGFNAGGKVERPDQIYQRSHPRKTNKEMFANVKAQRWWTLSDRFRQTHLAIKELEAGTWNPENADMAKMVFLDSKMPYLNKLVDELCSPRESFADDGRVMVESKSDMAKANRDGGPVASTNIADAAIMAVGGGRPRGNVSAGVLASI